MLCETGFKFHDEPYQRRLSPIAAELPAHRIMFDAALASERQAIRCRMRATGASPHAERRLASPAPPRAAGRALDGRRVALRKFLIILDDTPEMLNAAAEIDRLLHRGGRRR